MLTEIRSALAAFVDEPPEELVAHFAAPTRSDIELRIRLLPLDEALRYTESIRTTALIAKPMGLIALDDANDSDPYCYVTRGPARGCVLRLRHDDDAAIEFTSLRDFVAAIDAALVERRRIGDLPGKDRRPAVDQDRLGDHLTRLCSTTSEEAVAELTTLLRLLETTRVGVVRLLARHSSFFVREAAAELLASHPSADCLEVAELLANDAHPQVARPGKRALSAVRRATRGS